MSKEHWLSPSSLGPVQRILYLLILCHHPPGPWRQRLCSITLTFNWTLTNAQTPTQNLPLLRSTKSRSGKENQLKRILTPVPHPYSSYTDILTHKILSSEIRTKVKEIKSPLPGNILTHILLCDGVCPAVVTKHLIGQINYPVTLNVTYLGREIKGRGGSWLKVPAILNENQNLLNLLLTSFFGKTAL